MAFGVFEWPVRIGKVRTPRAESWSGWSAGARWLDLRRPRTESWRPARAWAEAMVLIGGLLVLYRES